jgi:hypothetical protein
MRSRPLAGGGHRQAEIRDQHRHRQETAAGQTAIAQAVQQRLMGLISQALAAVRNWSSRGGGDLSILQSLKVLFQFGHYHRVT